MAGRREGWRRRDGRQRREAKPAAARRQFGGDEKAAGDEGLAVVEKAGPRAEKAVMRMEGNAAVLREWTRWW